MKKDKLWIVGLIILSVFLLFRQCENSKEKYLETFDVNSITEEEITEELVIALFIEEITNEVKNYYLKYYLGEIEVYNYEVKIVNIEKKESGIISVKFGVTPQIGAHNPLGYDELSYSVDSRGNKSLITYEHLKNYEVPRRFQVFQISS